MGALKFNPKNKNEKQKRRRRRRSQKEEKKKGTMKRNTESASLQAIPSRAAEIPIPKGPHSPLKLCVSL
jgi:hypothetical protein